MGAKEGLSIRLDDRRALLGYHTPARPATSTGSFGGLGGKFRRISFAISWSYTDLTHTHKANVGNFPDDAIEVLRQGWKLESSSGKILVLQVRDRPVSQKSPESLNGSTDSGSP